MSTPNDGGQAFPATGMSLRDWLAGQFVAQLSPSWAETIMGEAAPTGPEIHEWMARARARWRYREADAMLAERSKP